MDLDNIAMLARLNIPPEERGRLERDMQDIINMAGRLEEIETDRERSIFRPGQRNEAGRAGLSPGSGILCLKTRPPRQNSIFWCPELLSKGGRFMQDIISMTVIELSAAMKKGEISPKEVLEAYLARIEAKDRKINAYITLDAENALKRAGKDSSGRSFKGRAHGG